MSTSGTKADSGPLQEPTPLGGTRAARSSRWRRRAWLIVVVCVAMVVVGVGVRLALPAALASAAKGRIPKYLAPPASVEAVHLVGLGGRATLRGLRVSQPAGFGDGLLLDLPEATVDVAVLSLLASPLTVREVAITGMTVHLVRDRDGTMNAASLVRSRERPEEPAPPKAIHIERIAIRDSSVHYTDLALGEAPLAITICPFDAVITDVYLGPARSREPSLPGGAEVIARLVQPGFPDALFGMIARFGYLDSGQSTPAANAALRLAGLELQPLQGLVPWSVLQAIGSDVLDLNVDVAMADDVLDGTFSIVTPAGNALSLRLEGTPGQPVLDTGDLGGMLRDRAVEAGTSALSNAAGAGQELGGSALSSGAAAGRGAGRLLKSLASGLAEAVVSVSKGNLSAAGNDLWDATSAAVTDTGEMVGESGARLAEGASRTAFAAAGGDRDRLWRADTGRRWSQGWAEACTSVPERRFPGYEGADRPAVQAQDGTLPQGPTP